MEPPKAVAAQQQRIIIPNSSSSTTTASNRNKHAGAGTTTSASSSSSSVVAARRMKIHGMLVIAALLSLGGYTTLFFLLHLDPHQHRGGTAGVAIPTGNNNNNNARSMTSDNPQDAPPIRIDCSEQVRRGKEQTKIEMEHEFKLREEKRQQQEELVAEKANAALERAAATTTSSDEKHSNNHNRTRRTVFALDRAKFVEDVAACIRETSCHVFYHHVQKTGGWFLASTLYPVLNGGEQYNDRVWCCDLDFVERFRQNTTHYCNLKLSVLEVHGDHLQEIVDTCQRQYASAASTAAAAISNNSENNNNNNNNNTSSGAAAAERAIVVQTVRDPVERVISWVHQLCNKMLRDIAPALQEACRRCSYRNDTALWDDFVQNQIDIYQKLLYAVPVPVYTIENVMIDPMLALLEARLGLEFPKGYRNLEGKKHVCDFHLPSALLKLFRDNRMVYRQLLTGMFAGENPQQQA